MSTSSSSARGGRTSSSTLSRFIAVFLSRALAAGERAAPGAALAKQRRGATDSVDLGAAGGEADGVGDPISAGAAVTDDGDAAQAELLGRAEDAHADAVASGAAGALGEHVKALLGAEAVEGYGGAAPGGHRLLRVAGRGLGDRVLDDLAAGVGAAGRADAMRQPRAVAARAAIEAGLAGLVLGAALVAAGARGSLLRDGHRSRDGSGSLSKPPAQPAMRRLPAGKIWIHPPGGEEAFGLSRHIAIDD